MATTENEPTNPRVCVYCGSTKAAPICGACCDDGHLESAELTRLRAEVERLEGELATETRAVERLTAMLPPTCREAGGPFVGQGDWSVYAEKVANERDEARAALATETGAVERLAKELSEGPAETPCNERDCGDDRGVDNCDGDCAACWAAWARQKEVGK